MNAKATVILIALGIMLTMAACQLEYTSDTSQTPDLVQGVEWQWTSLTNQPARETAEVPDPEDYTIIFNQDGTFTGMADCNAIAGTYVQENGFDIIVGPSSLASCGEVSLETQYVDLLNSIVAGGPDGAGGLALETAAGEQRMTFRNGDSAE